MAEMDWKSEYDIID